MSKLWQGLWQGVWMAGLALLVAACSESEAPPVEAPPVMLVRVESRDIEDRIEATGELLARSQAAVAAEVAGRITLVRVDEGVGADAGQVVLEIDPERRQLDLDSARAGLTEALASLHDAQRDLERITKLHEKAAASNQRLDQARTDVALARSRHAAAKASVGVADRALRDASVVAPFAGLIAERMVSVGEFVNVGTPLFRLVALNPVEVEFHLAERDSARVDMGDKVSVSVAPYPGERFEAKVTVVSPTIDTRTRTLAVKAELDNSSGRLRPGLFAKVDLGVNHRSNVLMLPEEAVLQRADGAVVFRLVDGDRVERRRVELGVFLDGWVEAASGLEPDDWVVGRGQAELVDGALVSPRNADGNPLGAVSRIGAGPGETLP